MTPRGLCESLTHLRAREGVMGVVGHKGGALSETEAPAFCFSELTNDFGGGAIIQSPKKEKKKKKTKQKRWSDGSSAGIKIPKVQL